jgi:hypothetical protein
MSLRKARIYWGERIRHALCWLRGGHVYRHVLNFDSCAACGKRQTMPLMRLPP